MQRTEYQHCLEVSNVQGRKSPGESLRSDGKEIWRRSGKRREEFSLDEKEIIVEGFENEKWKDTRQLSH